MIRNTWYAPPPKGALLRARLFGRGDRGECARLGKLIDQLDHAHYKQKKREESEGIMVQRQEEKKYFEENMKNKT